MSNPGVTKAAVPSIPLVLTLSLETDVGIATLIGIAYS